MTHFAPAIYRRDGCILEAQFKCCCLSERRPVIGYMALWIIAFLGSSVSVAAQDGADAVPQSDTPDLSGTQDSVSSNSEPDPIYTPLSLKQKWLYSVSQIFGANRLATYAANAVYDQIYDVPKQWGRNGDSLAVRLASHFGDSFIRYNVQFALQSLDHEDPRYFRSHLQGAWHRTSYAVVHTLVVRKDDQSWMPAYSLLVTDYGMPYVIRQWRPERFQTMNELGAGTMGLGIRIGSNVFAEFWPDLKKKLTRVPLLRGRIAAMP